jgi:hypothetical protein
MTVNIPPSDPGKQRKSPAVQRQVVVSEAAGKRPAVERLVQSSQPAVKFSPASLQKNPLSLAADLGLPRDTLSASLISFARYFALSLDPDQILKLRAQVLRTLVPAKHTPAKVPGRDALALAASAVLDKGLELSDEALRAYAEALDPGADGESGGGKGGNSASGGERDAGPNHGGNRNKRKALSPEAEALRRLCAESAGTGRENPLLYLLNAVSGGDGRRWIVLPFEFEDNGAHFKASLRILLPPGAVKETSVPSGKLALDIIREKSGDPQRRWLFIADQKNNEALSLTVYRKPAPPKKEERVSAKRLAALFSLPLEHICLQFSSEFPSFAPEAREEVLLSINKEV